MGEVGADSIEPFEPFHLYLFFFEAFDILLLVLQLSPEMIAGKGDEEEGDGMERYGDDALLLGDRAVDGVDQAVQECCRERQEECDPRFHEDRGEDNRKKIEKREKGVTAEAQEDHGRDEHDVQEKVGGAQSEGRNDESEEADKGIDDEHVHQAGNGVKETSCLKGDEERQGKEEPSDPVVIEGTRQEHDIVYAK